MLKTLAKLHFGTGAIAGTCVFYTNYTSMNRTYPKRLSTDNQKMLSLMMNTVITSKSIYYGLLWPVIITNCNDKNIGRILYPCYSAKITINDKEFSYVKNKNSNVFHPNVLIGNDLKSGINVEY